MALAPWLGYCVVANCFTGLGFFQCFFTVTSVTMWVFSILGLDVIYRDDTFEHEIAHNAKYARINDTMQSLFWIAIMPLWLSVIILIITCLCMVINTVLFNEE